MNGREYFHESVVKDIVDILTDLKDFDEVQFINNANAKEASSLLLLLQRI